MDHTFHTLDEDDLLTRIQLRIFIILGLKGNGLVILDEGKLLVDDLDGHAVVGGGVLLAGEDVAGTGDDAHPVQEGFYRLTVGADDVGLSPIDDCDHLHPLDVDAADAVVIRCGVGILLAQLNARLIQHHIRVRAVRLVNSHEITIGDDKAVLCENSQGQQADDDSRHQGHGDDPVGNLSAGSELFRCSAHQSYPPFQSVWFQGVKLLLLYCNCEIIITFFLNLSSIFRNLWNNTNFFINYVNTQNRLYGRVFRALTPNILWKSYKSVNIISIKRNHLTTA